MAQTNMNNTEKLNNSRCIFNILNYTEILKSQVIRRTVLHCVNVGGKMGRKKSQSLNNDLMRECTEILFPELSV